MIGMVLLRPGWERDYEGRPPIYPIGCSGVHHPRRAAARRPLQHRAARHRAVPDRRGGSLAQLPPRGDRAAARARRSTPAIAPAILRQRAKLESMLGAEPVERRRSADARRRCPTRIWSTRSRSISISSRSRSRRCSRRPSPAHPRRIAGRAAGDEDPDGPHAWRFDLRTLRRGSSGLERPGGPGGSTETYPTYPTYAATSAVPSRPTCPVRTRP